MPIKPLIQKNKLESNVKQFKLEIGSHAPELPRAADEVAGSVNGPIIGRGAAALFIETDRQIGSGLPLDSDLRRSARS